MTRRLLPTLSILMAVTLAGCTDSQLPSVPPPPPPGTVKPQQPGGALPEGFMKGNTGKPAPSTPKAL